MSNGSGDPIDDSTLFDSHLRQTYFIQFYVFLGLFVPSFICSTFDLYHLLRDRTLRRALHNHIIILLLVMNLLYLSTDILLFIYYFRNYETFSPLPIFRMLWGYLDWTLSYAQFALYAWATIERHILVFHDHLFSTKRKRLFFHYLPPAILTAYGLLYYALIIFVVPCENDFDDIYGPAFLPCSYYNIGLFLYEIVVQEALSILTIVFSSVVLLLRVLWQKYFVHRQMNWARYRKMVIQVLSISLIYLVFPFPVILVTVLYWCGVPLKIGAASLTNLQFFYNYTLLLFPMAVLGSSTELRGKLRKTLSFGQRRRQQRTIGPTLEVRAIMTDNRVTIQ